MGISIIDSIISGGIKGTLEGIGTLAKDIRSALTGEISPEKKAEMQEKLLEMEFLSQNAQTAINMEEAKHPNLFVAGWRPAVGWICAFGLAWNFILFPSFVWFANVLGSDVQPPVLDVSELIVLLMGLLGIGGLRTFEKYTKSEQNR